jgi:hypothetical protein
VEEDYCNVKAFKGALKQDSFLLEEEALLWGIV